MFFLTAFAQVIQVPIQTIREKATFPDLTVNETLDILNFTRNAFTVYANKPVKTRDFHVDPIAQMEELMLRPNLSSKDLHLSIHSIFTSLHDFHSFYNFPTPHACFLTLSGATWKIASENNTDYTVYAGPYHNTNGELPDVNTNITSLMKMGDILISINGLSFNDYVNKNQLEFGGANTAASHRVALDRLTLQSGMFGPLPKEDVLLLELLNVDTRQTYRVELPWIASYLPSCVDKVIAGSTLKPPTQLSLDWAAKPRSKHLTQNINGFEILSPSLSWSKYKTMGIFKLMNFENGYDVLAIHNTLEAEFSQVDSILIDVRGNPGGSADLVRKIAVQFTNHYRSFKARTIKSPVNNYVIEGLQKAKDFTSQQTVKAYKGSSPKTIYSNSFVWDDLSIKPQYGLLKKRRIGLLTDANCFSACDIFAATLKDSGDVIVFGEDANTGGGGANVFSSEVLSLLAPNIFDYKTPIDLGIGWRQILHPNEAFIEDVGITSDYIVRPTLQDVKNGTMQSQLEFIHQILRK